MFKKKSFYITTIILGILSVILSFFMNDIVSDSISGLMIGVGSGLVGLSIANLYMLNLETKKPRLAKQNEIELKDERNTLIRYRSKAAAGDVIQWSIMGFAFFTIIVGFELWITLTAVAVFLLFNIFGFFFMWKFQREM